MTDKINPKRWQKLAGLLTESVEQPLNEDVDKAKVQKQAEFIKSTPMMSPRWWNEVLADIRGMIAGEDQFDLRSSAYEGWSDEELQALLDELGEEREVTKQSEFDLMHGKLAALKRGELPEGSADSDDDDEKEDGKDDDDWDAVEASKWHGPAGSHLGPPGRHRKDRRRWEGKTAPSEWDKEQDKWVQKKSKTKPSEWDEKEGKWVDQKTTKPTDDLRKESFQVNLKDVKELLEEINKKK